MLSFVPKSILVDTEQRKSLRRTATNYDYDAYIPDGGGREISVAESVANYTRPDDFGCTFCVPSTQLQKAFPLYHTKVERPGCPEWTNESAEELRRKHSFNFLATSTQCISLVAFLGTNCDPILVKRSNRRNKGLDRSVVCRRRSPLDSPLIVFLLNLTSTIARQADDSVRIQGG